MANTYYKKPREGKTHTTKKKALFYGRGNNKKASKNAYNRKKVLFFLGRERNDGENAFFTIFLAKRGEKILKMHASGREIIFFIQKNYPTEGKKC